MSCFTVTDPFLTTFHDVKKRNVILRKNRGGRGLKNLTYPYMGRGGVKIAKIFLILIECPFMTEHSLVTMEVETRRRECL